MKDINNVWSSRVGEKINELTIIEYLGKTKVRCKCSCGKECIKNYYDIRKNKTKSCGHLKEQQKQEDLTGNRFSYLLAIEELEIVNGQREYLFLCDCGKKTKKMIKEVKRGRIKSCGCMMGYGSGAKPTHGLSKDRLYGIYKGMKRRCTNKNEKFYSDYGGRGIDICEEWMEELNGMQNFFDWANSNGYSNELTIDRIDNNSGYSPSNCRWVSQSVQANNKRSNIFYSYNGESKTLTEWAETLGLNSDSLWKRINKYNYSFEKAITYKIEKIYKNK